MTIKHKITILILTILTILFMYMGLSAQTYTYKGTRIWDVKDTIKNGTKPGIISLNINDVIIDGNRFYFASNKAIHVMDSCCEHIIDKMRKDNNMQTFDEKWTFIRQYKDNRLIRLYIYNRHKEIEFLNIKIKKQ